jgi:peroxiredoxin
MFYNGFIMKTGNNERLHDLQDRFQKMEPEIRDEKVKEALSIVYGMIQEVLRSEVSRPEQGQDPDPSGVADIYKKAPKMEGEAMNSPLEPGTKAPDFTLLDAKGYKVSLSDFKGSPVMLVFYPLDWSPGCSQQLDLYQHEWKEFESRGVKVLGISVDSIYSHGAWAAVRKIEFPLLSDFNPKGEVSEKYSVYRNTDGFSERALYLIDNEGVIRYSYVSPQIHHIPDIYQLLSKIEEIYKPAITI